MAYTDKQREGEGVSYDQVVMTTDRDIETLIEQREFIASWYDSLTDKQRQAVRLCWIEGYTQQEAAEELGITQQAVAYRLATAKRLAKRLVK